MEAEPVYTTVDPAEHPRTLWKIRDLLAQDGLGYDDDIEVFVVASIGTAVVGCLGLAGTILKCAAVAHDLRGHDIALRLMEEMNYVAVERGRPHLFLFTKPMYAENFAACGFHQIAEVKPLATLMENTPQGIRRYARSLRQFRVDGERIAGIVVNANPFTFGHQHLIRTAARECDHVHVFVVREDASMFSYADRHALVRAGVALLDERHKITVHAGSEYIVSRATFPSYFLKEKADLNRAATGLDLQLFRNHIAPALRIRHRYVGTEPFSAITNLYNDEMHRWLEIADLVGPPIEVHTVPRIGADAETPIISATEVRRRIADGDVESLATLVPQPTLDLIRSKYLPNQGALHEDRA